MKCVFGIWMTTRYECRLRPGKMPNQALHLTGHRPHVGFPRVYRT
jgi:hypothetical protein